jgi:hypothetical protein
MVATYDRKKKTTMKCHWLSVRLGSFLEHSKKPVLPIRGMDCSYFTVDLSQVLPRVKIASMKKSCLSWELVKNKHDRYVPKTMMAKGSFTGPILR